jgi:hypothetical protein
VIGADDAELVALAVREASMLSPARAAVVNAGASVLGLEPRDPRYRELVYRYDPPPRRAALADDQSACGLVRELLVEPAGVTDPRIKLGADVRGARGGILYPITLELTIARARGAVVEGKALLDFVPLPGDGIVQGCKGAPGVWSKGVINVEHMSTALATRAQVGGASFIVFGCDGGQPGIHARTRALVVCGPRGDELWAASLDADGAYTIEADGRPAKGRRVLAMIDLDREAP